jgi:thioredoxin 1
VEELSEDRFEDFIGKNSCALVDFFAPWCGPCRAMGPAIETLAEEFAGRAAIGKVDVDQCPALAERFAVRSVPTLIFFRNGEAVETLTGARSKEELGRKLAAHMDV